jgi:hypothetical protein
MIFSNWSSGLTGANRCPKVPRTKSLAPTCGDATAGMPRGAMRHQKLGLLLGAAAVIVGVATLAASATAQQVISDSQMQAKTTTVGGATVLPTTRTIPHWWGSTLDPHNGVTYGYNMVGANPNNCAGSACTVTVQADITPIIVNVGGPRRSHRRNSSLMTMA